MKRIVVLLLLASVAAAGCLSACCPSWSDVVCRVTSPEPRLIVVQVDPTLAERKDSSGLWRVLQRVRPWWVWKTEGRVAQLWRPFWERKLLREGEWSVSLHRVKRFGVWKSPQGQARFPSAESRLVPTLGAEVLYHIFLELETPLREGERIGIVTPLGRTLAFTREERVPTPLIKVNQVGYLPRATQRRAYLGGWLGSLGAWLPPREASTFEVMEDGTDRVVASGRCMLRGTEDQTAEGVRWTGEATYELDLSGLTSGRYYLRVPGVGRSYPFRVSEEGARQALVTHLHGLFVQRCGCSDKREPATAWGDAPCHRRVWRGTFPPGEADYAGNGKSRGCFSDASGRRVKISHFDVIARNTDWSRPPAFFPGGWHDAADYDRRPQHLEVVTDLSAIALLKNGHVPRRILDEADWGLRHLLAAQTGEGAVGGWIETVRHPREGEGMPSEDPLRYVLSRPTRASTLAFAAAAAELARCAPDLQSRLAEPAQHAWRWAHLTAPVTNLPFTVKDGASVRKVFWHEDPTLSARDELKAAIHFAALGRRHFLDELLATDVLPRFEDELRREGWTWSPLSILDIALTDDPRLVSVRTRVRRWLLAQADKRLAAQAQQPYCLPRWNGRDLGWGRSHPLVNARWLVAAHALTGEAKYWDAISLAQDYHCGCNPDGMTLTSGLGIVYPVRFLSLQSTADDVDEYVAGITPFRWCHGVGGNDYRYVHTPDEVDAWPIWRRRVNLEALSVGASEYTVFETIGPAVAVTAYLLDEAEGVNWPAPPRPRGRIEDLPGYWALP